MTHNNVNIYKGIEYLWKPHYQLIEYIFVLCINKQTMQLSRYSGKCVVKGFYGNCSNKINSIVISTLKTQNTNSFLNID